MGRNPIEAIRGAIRHRREEARYQRTRRGLEEALSNIQQRLEEDHQRMTPEELLRVDGPRDVFNLTHAARYRREMADRLVKDAEKIESAAADIHDALILRGLR